MVYDGLPLSSGSVHGLGRLSARDAVNKWLRFLEACTETSPVKCLFDFPLTPGLTIDPEVVRLIGREFPGGPRGHPVPWERAEDAISIFESLEPLPTNRWGMAPVWLWFTADFRLRSPVGELWPAQDPRGFGQFMTPTGVTLGTSATKLILEGKRGMGLALSIPRASDADLAEVVPWLQASLPFRLSSKHWTRWTLTKNRFSYRGRKILPATLT